MANYEPGIALFETGDGKAATGHFEIVASKMPKFADARFSLGSVYARIDRVGEAVTELKAAPELEPRHDRAKPPAGPDPHGPGRSSSASPSRIGRGRRAGPSSHLLSKNPCVPAASLYTPTMSPWGLIPRATVMPDPGTSIATYPLSSR